MRQAWTDGTPNQGGIRSIYWRSDVQLCDGKEQLSLTDLSPRIHFLHTTVFWKCFLIMLSITKNHRVFKASKATSASKDQLCQQVGLLMNRWKDLLTDGCVNTLAVLSFCHPAIQRMYEWMGEWMDVCMYVSCIWVYCIVLYFKTYKAPLSVRPDQRRS